MAPWQDSRGRLAPLKAIAFAALFVPAAWLLYGYLARMLGPRPLTEIIHASGDWAIRLLFVALAITPLRQILGWPGLITLRRMAGVAALAYAGLHLSVYVADVSFDLGKAAREIWLRSYLTIGFVALLALIPLGVTSTDAMIRRLGGKRWRRLHRASYAIAVLAIVHFFWQSKLDIREPVIMAGIFLWLMAFRLLPTAARRGRTLLAAMAGLAVLAAALAALIEALYYNLRVGAPLARVLEANLGFARRERGGDRTGGSFRRRRGRRRARDVPRDRAPARDRRPRARCTRVAAPFRARLCYGAALSRGCPHHERLPQRRSRPRRAVRRGRSGGRRARVPGPRLL
ncbi:MAG: protein-methionine-sulfoxide reductase heme-binding subunit MsrQ [Alphaproteobacteria bacterium]